MVLTPKFKVAHGVNGFGVCFEMGKKSCCMPALHIPSLSGAKVSTAEMSPTFNYSPFGLIQVRTS